MLCYIRMSNDPFLSEEAYVVAAADAIAEVSVYETGEGESGMIHIHSQKYGSMDFSVIDGDAEYLYSLTIYEDDEGHTQVDIAER